jgi:hypothetical protein
MAAFGCGSDPRAQNVAEFKERMMDSGYGVAFAPGYEGRPGMVAGVVQSADGFRSLFIFSFGPGPDKLPETFRARGGTVWFGLGDRLEYWIQNYPRGLRGPRFERALQTISTVRDAACLTVADRPCF